MSVPASLKGGPITTNTLISKKYIFFYVFLIWASILPVLYFVWKTLPGYYENLILFIVLLPFYGILWYLVLVADAIIFTKILLVIINLIHKPKEGYFPREKKNIEYRFWSMRATIKKFAFWVTHNCPLPWLDIIAFKMFGVKLGSTTALFDAYVDAEFIEIGDNSVIGMGAVIMSTMVTKDWLILKKVKIGNNVVIGTHSVVSPGTMIGDNTILGGLSATSVGQELEPNWVYMGVPCRKYRKNEYLSKEESEEEMDRKRQLFKQYLTIDEMEEMEEGKSRKERREEKKQERTSRKFEKKLEKQEKKLISQEKRIERYSAGDLTEKDERKADKIQEKIEKKMQKAEKIREKLTELSEKIQGSDNDQEPDEEQDVIE